MQQLADSLTQTVDTNSAHFAKYCFLLGMQLKRVEVIGDDEAEIVEATRRMSENYDFVVTRQVAFSPTSIGIATLLP